MAVFLKRRSPPTQTSALIIVQVCSRERMQQIVGEQTKVRSAACIDVATEANERAGIVITQVCSRESMPKHTHKGEHRRECRCTGVAGRSIDLNCAARYLEFDGAKLWDLNYRLHGNVAPKPQQPKHTRVPSVAQACATNSGDRESAGQAVEWWRRHLPNQPSFVELGVDCR